MPPSFQFQIKFIEEDVGWPYILDQTIMQVCRKFSVQKSDGRDLDYLNWRKSH